MRDPIHVQQELIRIKSLNSYLDRVGLQEHLYEVFVDATEDIFAQTSQAIHNGDQDETFLVNAFNEEYSSQAIITHFRVCFCRHEKIHLSPSTYVFLLIPLAPDKCLDEA